MYHDSKIIEQTCKVKKPETTFEKLLVAIFSWDLMSCCMVAYLKWIDMNGFQNREKKNTLKLEHEKRSTNPVKVKLENLIFYGECFFLTKTHFWTCLFQKTQGQDS